MIYTYEELKNKGLDNYNINKKIETGKLFKIEAGKLFKIEAGLYSSAKIYNQLEYITKKYSNAIFTLDSAFFYLGLTDYIPSKYFLATKHNAQKIQNEKIEQVFVSNHLFEIGKINSMSLLINTKEQIFVEKLSSMLKHGIRTTRYKDVYDFYYLITEGNMDKSLLIELINV